jgi:hypothetical protein
MRPREENGAAEPGVNNEDIICFFRAVLCTLQRMGPMGPMGLMRRMGPEPFHCPNGSGDSLNAQSWHAHGTAQNRRGLVR